jgi:hypothetical protein
MRRLDRFMVKLGKMFYCEHIGEVLDGANYARHINATVRNSTPEFFSHMRHLAPALASTERDGHSLMDQFVYRFEPRQVCRRLFGLSYAARAVSCNWA